MTSPESYATDLTTMKRIWGKGLTLRYRLKLKEWNLCAVCHSKKLNKQCYEGGEGEDSGGWNKDNKFKYLHYKKIIIIKI